MTILVELIIATGAVLLDALLNCSFDSRSFNKLGNWLVHRSLAVAGVAFAMAFWVTVPESSPMALITIIFFLFSVLVEWASKIDSTVSDLKAFSLNGAFIGLFINLPGIAAVLYGILYAKGLIM